MAWAGASVFFTAVLEVSDLGHKSLSFALYSNAVHFALWTILLPALWWGATSFPISGKRKGWKGLATLLLIPVLAALATLTHLAIVYSTYFPYRSAYSSFRLFLESELIRFMPVDILIGIAIEVGLIGWKAWQAFQDEHTRAKELEQQVVVARLEALRMQLHPHFLFNTLHTLASLTAEDPPTAQRMVIALGDFLRITLRDTCNSMRTLAEELEFSDLYLGIEKLRFGDRLVLNYDIDPSATRALVPQFLLQPLFENAIRHGASRLTGPCEIQFCASQKTHTLYLMIRNDGPKRDASLGSPQFGVGLTNTLDRLRIYYANQYTFQYAERSEGGVQINISLPLRNIDDENSLSEPITGQASSLDRLRESDQALPRFVLSESTSFRRP
jgi:sensor histidine kinase YesM